MREYTKKIILIALALAVVFIVPSVMALRLELPSTKGGELQPAAPTTQPYFYSYLLEEEQGTASDESKFTLYVQGGAKTAGETAPMLHGGSITLGLEALLSGEDVGQLFDFQEDPAYKKIAYLQTSGSAPAGPGVETGTAGERPYIGFSWYIDQGKDDLVDSIGGKQKIGVLTIRRSDVKLQEVDLIAWPETKSGVTWVSELLAAAGDDASREEILEYINSTWRMPDETSPENGFYQGYYAKKFEDGAGPEGEEHAVDITAAWQKFTISAYAADKPTTLLFYAATEDGDYSAQPLAKAVLDQSGIEVEPDTLRYTQTVDFTELTYTDAEETALPGGLPSGTYKLVVVKPSHLTWQATGVTVTADMACPQLTGHKAVLPCGNIGEPVRDGNYIIRYGDDRIKLEDRSVLLRYLNRSATGDTHDPADLAYYADLNGDGSVTIADLNIMMAAENYNRVTVEERL